MNPLQSLIEARETLDTLLANYKRATIDCTFADVPRELLETKNKDLLLEKAATNALFDKSASIETCKTTNRVVRDYLGLTGKGTYIVTRIDETSLMLQPGDTNEHIFFFQGPLVGIEKQISSGLKFVDPDFSDDYISGKFGYH